jgi:signal peptidase I
MLGIKEGFLGEGREKVESWIRDFIDVALTLAVTLILLKVLFGAQMIVPLVVVTTGSMVHHEGDNSWIHWLNDRGVGNDTINNMPFTGGFNPGDMMVVMRPEANIGDVIIYERDFIYGSAGMEPIIHRVVGIVYVNDSRVVGSEGTLDCFKNEDFNKYIEYVDKCRVQSAGCPYPSVPKTNSYKFYLTKGDANAVLDQCASKNNISIPVNEAQIPAKALVRLPYVGWLKLILNEILRIPIGIIRLFA